MLPEGFDGGAKRDRTADLYNAIVALSQLSYSPVLHRVRTGFRQRGAALYGDTPPRARPFFINLDFSFPDLP